MTNASDAQSADLQAILQNQQAQAPLRAAIAQLQATIQQHEEGLQSAVAELSYQEKQLNELLADIAVGRDLGRDLNGLRIEQEGKIAANRSAVRTHDQTLAGLRVRLEGAQAELGRLKGKSQPLIRALLLARAQALGVEYVQAAKSLTSLHELLRGVCSVIRDLGGLQYLSRGMALEIPSFGLESVLPHQHRIYDGLIVKSNGTHADVLASVDAVKRELIADGIHLD